jgi:hypothetical protein
MRRSPHRKTPAGEAIGTSASPAPLLSATKLDVRGKVRTQHVCDARLGKKPLWALELAPVPHRQMPQRWDAPAPEARFRAGGSEGNTASKGGNFHYDCLLYSSIPNHPKEYSPDCHTAAGINESAIE